MGVCKELVYSCFLIMSQLRCVSGAVVVFGLNLRYYIQPLLSVGQGLHLWLRKKINVPFLGKVV